MHTAEGRFELALALRIAAAQARREQINHAP